MKRVIAHGKLGSTIDWFIDILDCLSEFYVSGLARNDSYAKHNEPRQQGDGTTPRTTNIPNATSYRPSLA